MLSNKYLRTTDSSQFSEASLQEKNVQTRSQSYQARERDVPKSTRTTPILDIVDIVMFCAHQSNQVKPAVIKLPILGGSNSANQG